MRDLAPKCLHACIHRTCLRSLATWRTFCLLPSSSPAGNCVVSIDSEADADAARAIGS